MTSSCCHQCEELQKLLDEKEKLLIQELGSSEKLKNDLNEAELKCKKLNSDILNVENSSHKIQIDLEKVQRENSNFAEEKSKLLSILNDRDAEISKLNDELKSVDEQLAVTRKNKSDMFIRAEELQSKEVKLQYQEKRLNQELEFANQQISLLNGQIMEKNQQLLSINSNKMNQIVQLQSELDSKSDQVKFLEEKFSNSNLAVDNLEKTIKVKNNDIEKLQKDLIQMEMEYQQELKAQKKLSDLYKKSSEEHSNKVSELMKAVDELQKFIEKSTQDHESLEKNYNENIESHEQMKKEMEVKIEKQQTELKHANDLLQSRPESALPSTVEDLYPEAAATSKLLKSGKSLTSLYSDYVNNQQELLEQRQENEQLKEYLENVLQEVEERAPSLVQQRSDYEKALATITGLNMKLDCAIKEREEALKERDQQTREAHAISRENQRLKQELIDLSSQIRILLKEVEITRGNFIAEDDNQVSSSDESSSAKLISKRLVTFKNIEELQKQNSQLLAVVRQLSEEQELKEKNLVDERTAQLVTDLESMKTHLEELNSARNRQETILDSVISQRDMYKRLLAENGSKMEESSMVGKSPQKKSEHSELTMIISQMKDEERRFKEESSENMRILTEQLETVRNKSFEIKLENGRLTSQNEGSLERIGVLQHKLDDVKRETEIFQEKNKNLTNLVSKHEESISKASKELLMVQSDLSRIELSYENLKNEYNLLKSREEILIHDNESLLKERRSQGEVLANLQMLQANLERVEAERKLNLQSQLDKTTKENELLRKKVEANTQEFKDAVQLWEKKLEDMRLKLDKETENVRRLESERSNLMSEMKDLKNKGPSLAVKQAATPAAAATSDNQKSEKLLQETREQLSKSKSQIEDLSAELKLKDANMKKFQNLASEIENKLKETLQASKSVEKELTTKISNLSEALKKADDDKHKMNLRNQELFNEVQETTKQSKAQIQSTLNELMETKVQLQDTKNRLIAAQKNMEEAVNDSKKQLDVANKAEQKYQHELMLHANDIQEQTKMKSEMGTFNEQIHTAKENENHALNQLEEFKKSWKTQEDILKKNCADYEVKLIEIQSQNDVLHEQIQLMNTQIVTLKNAGQSASTFDVLLNDDDDKTSQQLWDVVKYLRKEKELQSALYDSEKAQNARLLSQKEHAENNVQALERRITELQKQAESSQSEVSMSAKHNELMKKVQLMNMMEESNSMLRQEIETLRKATSEQTTKIAGMQTAIDGHDATFKEVVSDKESAVVENSALRGEVKRWQQRVKQLTEQMNKYTPADQRRMTEEIDGLKKKCQLQTNEIESRKTEMNQLKSFKTALESERDALRQKCESDQKEIAHLKDTVQNMPAEKELVEKRKVIAQVKNIAKKYKDLYTSETKKTEELEGKAKTSEELMQSAQERIKNLEAEVLEKESLQQKIKELNEKLTKTKSETDEIVLRARTVANQANSNVNGLKAEKANLTSELEEYKLRLSTLQSQHEGATTKRDKEIESLKQIQAQKETVAKKQEEEFKAQIVALQKQVLQQQQVSKPSTASGPVVTTSSETPTANIKPMSTPASAAARHVPPQRESGSSASGSGSARTNTPTASIKPMAIGSASATPVSRTATVMPTTTVISAAVLPQVSEIIHDDHQTQAASSLSPPPHVGVRQATVTPTAVHPPASVLLSQQAPTVAVLPNVQEPTSSAVEETNFVNEPLVPPSGPSPIIIEPTRIEVTETSENLAVPSTSAPRIKRPREEMENESAKRSKSQGISAVEVGVQAQHVVNAPSAAAHVIASQPTSSQVTETSNVVESIPPTANQEPVTEMSLQPAAEAVETPQREEPADDDDVIVVEIDDDDEEEEEDEDEEEDFDEDDDGEDEEEDDMEESADEEEDDKNMEGSDKQEFEVERIDECTEDEATADSDQVMDQENFDEEDETRDEEGDEEDDNYENDEMAEAVANEGDDDDIEIIDDQEQAEEPSHQDTEEVAAASMMVDSSSYQDAAVPAPSQELPPPSVSQVPSIVQPSTNLIRANVPGRSERLPSFGRQQLTPFAQNQGYEEGDDSIVPSTPTLIVPRRTDGFAEAVSSPQVPHGRFVFSNQNQDANVATAPGVSLASQALGVDDTRMDLLQFDDGTTPGTGRSVPTTPLQVSSPGEESIPDDRLPTQTVVVAATIVSSSASSQPRIDGKPTQTSLSLDEHSFSAQSENTIQARDEPGQASGSVATTSPNVVPVAITSLSEHVGESNESSSSDLLDTTAITEPSQEFAGQAETGPNIPQQSQGLDSTDQPRQTRRPIVWDSPNRTQSNPVSVGAVQSRRLNRQIRIRGRVSTRARAGQRAGRSRPR